MTTPGHSRRGRRGAGSWDCALGMAASIGGACDDLSLLDAEGLAISSSRSCSSSRGPQKTSPSAAGERWPSRGHLLVVADEQYVAGLESGDCRRQSTAFDVGRLRLVPDDRNQPGGVDGVRRRSKADQAPLVGRPSRRAEPCPRSAPLSRSRPLPPE